MKIEAFSWERSEWANEQAKLSWYYKEGILLELEPPSAQHRKTHKMCNKQQKLRSVTYVSNWNCVYLHMQYDISTTEICCIILFVPATASATAAPAPACAMCVYISLHSLAQTMFSKWFQMVGTLHGRIFRLLPMPRHLLSSIVPPRMYSIL